MTREDRARKSAVRARMKKTGESYAAANVAMARLTDVVEPLDYEQAWSALDTLREAGIDADGFPMFLVEGRIVGHQEALDYLVEQGLEDPDVLRED